MSLESEHVERSRSLKDKYRFSAGATLLIFYQWLAGMGSYCFILTMPIYMASILGFSDARSTIIFHAKSALSHLMNIFGAVVADSLLGRLKTGLVFLPIDVAFMVGMAVMSVYTFTPGIITFYFVVAVVGGLVSPALRTFMADQIPSNDPLMLSAYMHILYFVNNFGVIIVAFTAPIMHKDIHCFAMECYPLVFTTSVILTSLALSLFLLGYFCRKFVVNPPTNDLFLNILRCVHLAIKRRIKLGKPKSGKSFLDYSEGDFDAAFIKDLKIVMGLCVFLVAHPLFWAVFEQISSIWTLQAQYMDGLVTTSFEIKADQMQTLNPILVVLLIPIFEVCIYPLLDRIKFKVPYRIVAGQAFTALACASMVLIQLQIDRALRPVSLLDNKQINFLNLHSSNVTISVPGQTLHLLTSKTAVMVFPKNGNVTFQSRRLQFQKALVSSGSPLTVIFQNANLNGMDVLESPVKLQEKGGYGFVRMINLLDRREFLDLRLTGRLGINIVYKLGSGNGTFGEYVKCGVGVFDVSVILDGRQRLRGSVTLRPAETKAIVIVGPLGSEKMIQISEFHLTLPTIFLQVIPYILVTIGEVLFNVNTGIFLYGEAPMSMKTILMAGQYVCIAIGNILIIILKKVLGDLGSIYLFFICGIFVMVSGILTGILGFFYLRNKERMTAYDEVHRDVSKL